MKGTYLLLLRCTTRLADLAIGRLGQYTFEPGWYLYIGSACGPGGIPARLAHHTWRIRPRPHWHIDYLRAHTEVAATWSIGGAQIETAWLSILLRQPELVAPVRGFGASDTRTPAQLLYTPRPPSARMLHATLMEALGDRPDVTIDICIHKDDA